MDTGSIISPENIEQLKGVVSTLVALGGFDVLTGMISNKKIKRLSFLLNFVIRVLNVISFAAIGTADALKKVQDYGKEKVK